MPSGKQFTATGASDGSTLVGFQTSPGARMERGADVTGDKIGVIGTGTSFGVQARGTGNRSVGVDAEGREVGVIARGPGAGSTGVQATGGKLGVQSQGGEVGVEGHGPVGVKGFGNTGVDATGTKIGVVAKGPVGVQGTGSPGGRFVSGDRHAQLHLEPHPLEPGSRVPVTPTELKPAGNQLPKTGQLGDLWLTQHDGGPPRCSLWLCVGASGGNAMWAQVLLGTPITGTKTPQVTPGEG